MTWIPSLGTHVMTYIAFGPLGPKPALAIPDDLRSSARLGPLHFEYQLDTDLNLFPNKDTVFFPEPVPGSGGEPAYAMLHRPMWDLGWFRDGEGVHLPAGVTDNRPGIWVSFVPVAEVEKDVRNLVHLSDHQPVAMSEYPFEELKIGAVPTPLRVPEGLAGDSPRGDRRTTQGVRRHDPEGRLRGGAPLLDPSDVTKVIDRTAEPILVPEIEDERIGTVGNVVFPTAIEEVDGVRYVFYGMADAATVTRIAASS